MCEPMNPAAPVMRMRMPVPNHAGPAPGSQRDAPSHLRKGQSRYAGIIVPVMLTDVILPCLNEAAALPWVLDRMPPGYRAIVADNGSDDGSAEVAARHGAVVVTVPQRGFGAACHGGLLAATSELVCIMDADGSLDPADLPLVTAQVRGGSADLVLGARRPSGRGAWPLHARLGNLATADAVRRRTGVRLHDLGPMRAGRRAALIELGITDRRFGYPLEMVV